MVTTRGTLFQDQERQKRTLSSLRLHYVLHFELPPSTNQDGSYHSLFGEN